MDYKTIDIREQKETGIELKKLIQQAVADTQRTIIRELPDTLVLTGPQYDSLQDDDEMRGFWTTQERVYVTELNCMNVVIK